MPLFVVMGALSDRIGRKRLMMAGCLLAVLTYIPIYQAMQRAAGSGVVTAISQRHPVTRAISLTPQAMVDGVLTPAPEVLTYHGLADLASQRSAWLLAGLVFLQVVLVTMVYGPIAAYLVEAFPARIRYTAMSLPYHVGNGVFGGLLPLIGLSVIARTGNIYAGLYYPMAIAAITFVVGSLLLKETHREKIWTEVGK
jgi:MFS family permease